MVDDSTRGDSAVGGSGGEGGLMKLLNDASNWLTGEDSLPEAVGVEMAHSYDQRLR